MCGALFFVILEPKSYMVRSHKLQLDLGKYCGSILGLSLSYMQPTMNPCGCLVVKQAENLRYSACMENEEGRKGGNESLSKSRGAWSLLF